MAAIVLPVLIAVTMLVTIVAEYRGPRLVVYVFKPMTTVLIIVLAATAQEVDRTYQILIAVGLVFSLAGDVFLMLPEAPRSYFMPGLVVFLIAHLFYIGAFVMGTRWANQDVLVLLPFVAFGVGCTAYLWRHLGPMKAPVVVYTAVILSMGWRSAARIYAPDLPTTAAICAFVGVGLFIISDLILAVNRFARPFVAARATNLTTYFAGQACIALSLHL